jgi:cobaltochelatase CobN
MHLLAAQPGSIQDGSEAIDLGQTAGEIVVLSAADSELAALAAARATLGADFPSLRLASLLHLGHNLSVDRYVEAVIAPARLVVLRLLGGRSYWPYGLEQVVAVCREKGILVVCLPGDEQPDADLAAATTIESQAAHRMWRYFVEGGVDNAANLLRFAASLIGETIEWEEPRPLLRAGLYRPGTAHPNLNALRADWTPDAPVAALVFYRALFQAGNLEVIDALIAALRGAGLNALPLYVASLKDSVSAATVEAAFAEAPPAVILNTTGFAVSVPGAARASGPFDGADCPVLQVVLSGGTEEAWRAGTTGLGARDIAMNVALPEVDGRILARAVSFKSAARRDPLTETDIVTYKPVADRIAFTARLAAAWARLKGTPPGERRIALVLANYPNRDGRLGNGVGLDTPASVIGVLEALAQAGYGLRDIPADGDALIRRMQAGPTNDLDALSSRRVTETLSLIDYEAFFSRLPQAVRDRVVDRWGPAERDPFFRPSSTRCGDFALPVMRCGNIVIGLQPARGYNIDPAASYHDPDLPPPHAYFAFYAWLGQVFGAQAVVHMGKHGNLEWLPGKALALSGDCFPEAALGPMPHLYPFIVNDPGEGSQAKRRAAAVIIDHLTPPLTRAESYGPLRDLEGLVDEYFEAAGLDPRRLKLLNSQIIDLCRATGVDVDCGIEGTDDSTAALGKLDSYLCELKEMQIRDGLHIFGKSPEGRLLDDLLVALARVPRGRGDGGDASLLRALAGDLALGFDPLSGEAAAPWTGPRPAVLKLSDDDWRSSGDTIERLELLASALVSGTRQADPSWSQTRAVLAAIDSAIRPAVAASGDAEIAGLLAGLDGRFVLPGPSGAPTRGRPDVLPTGRNFFSVDTRTVPTPAAWTLGWKSAAMLVERYTQDHGVWPRAMALTAWGTSNMRTGGDDIAQALALMGVRPTWDAASRRVVGFEVMPLSVLDRPRVDVTLRISGFFRDAFPMLIDLFDSAVRAVAELDEPDDKNPLAARVKADSAGLRASGVDADEARLRAGFRVFGSKPGAYGAGLQALIDEKGWETDADLARAYIAWGGYAYGPGGSGEAAHGLFETRLKSVEAVVQNQDNREHDILDSDDYYQFEGGMTAAVRNLSGGQPAIYHNDHSRPETPAIRTLDEELGRVVRARAANPKWIAGVMRHGYKGAFEMAATVDYLFAFAATAHCVADHHFDLVFDAYLGDDKVRGFIEAHNPAALREMAGRFQEALDRGLWRPRINTVHSVLTNALGLDRVDAS